MNNKPRNPVHRNMQRCGAGAHDEHSGRNDRLKARMSTDDILAEYYDELEVDYESQPCENDRNT